jgi:hypothetical protein
LPIYAIFSLQIHTSLIQEEIAYAQDP